MRAAVFHPDEIVGRAAAFGKSRRKAVLIKNTRVRVIEVCTRNSSKRILETE